jgi:hypothetical protein
MKVQRHKDGSWSITGLTREDLSNISLGMCDSAASRTQWSGMNDADRAWVQRKMDKAARLNNILDVAGRMRGAGSMLVTSDEMRGEDPYFVEQLHNVRGWNDEPNITSGLPRTEGSKS